MKNGVVRSTLFFPKVENHAANHGAYAFLGCDLDHTLDLGSCEHNDTAIWWLWKDLLHSLSEVGTETNLKH